MRIYFTASTNNIGENRVTYEQILKVLRLNGHTIISGDQIISPQSLEKDKKEGAEEVFKREKKLIDSADAIVAEVSKPSLGVGGEIVYALVQRKPVLALLQTEIEDKISPMVAGNPSDLFFLEYYSENNLKFVLKTFTTFCHDIRHKKGKLIVVDGGDGSGKATQASLLMDYLKKKKIPNRLVDFPQYYQSFHGKVVAQFLRGEFGELNTVSPYLASLAYALDRASVKEEMNDFLQSGGIIVANRYATSNMAHQGAKITEGKKRDDFLKWVYDLEYKQLKIPKEDVVVYLYVPWKYAVELTKKKEVRAYLKGKSTDIHEADTDYRQKAEEMYINLCKKNQHWIRIDCLDKQGVIKTPQIIHEEIISALVKRKILPSQRAI